MSVMLVRADRLADAPLSFQEYVHDYFKEEVVFGIPVWRATCVVSRENGYGFRLGSGLAPSHSVDLMVYERRWEEPNITDWIYSDEAKASGIFHVFY